MVAKVPVAGGLVQVVVTTAEVVDAGGVMEAMGVSLLAGGLLVGGPGDTRVKAVQHQMLTIKTEVADQVQVAASAFSAVQQAAAGAS